MISPQQQSGDQVPGVRHGHMVTSVASDNSDNFIELQTVQMRLPVTMRPRLATVEAGSVSGSDCDDTDHVTRVTRVSCDQVSRVSDTSDEVKHCDTNTSTNNTTGTNNSTNNTITNPANNKTNIGDKSTSTNTGTNPVRNSRTKVFGEVFA